MGLILRNHWKAFPHDPDLRYLRNLKRRAFRGRVWHRLPTERRAMIKAVEWVLQKGDPFAEKIKTSNKIRTILALAMKRIEDMLALLQVRLSFKIRALREGARIARERTAIYREKGVFHWAPWVERWLMDAETMLYLGTTSRGWGIG